MKNTFPTLQSDVKNSDQSCVRRNTGISRFLPELFEETSILALSNKVMVDTGPLLLTPSDTSSSVVGSLYGHGISSHIVRSIFRSELTIPFRSDTSNCPYIKPLTIFRASDSPASIFESGDCGHFTCPWLQPFSFTPKRLTVPIPR
jgi:hypothetical protein